MRVRRVDARRPGDIYLRPDSEYYWCTFQEGRKRRRMSTKTTDEKEAIRFLQAKLAEISNGTFVPPGDQRTTVTDLYELVEQDYLANRQRVDTLSFRWKNLRPFVGHLAAQAITTKLATAYRETRLSMGAAIATVNREMALLRRMLNLAHRHGLVRSVPYLPFAREDNVRTGFLTAIKRKELEQELLRTGLPWLVTLLEIGRKIGWRKENWLSRRVRHVESMGAYGVVRMEPGETKNKRGIQVIVSGRAWELLKKAVAGKNDEDFVFTYPNGGRVRDIRYRWRNACRATGLARFFCPDCRREEAREVELNNSNQCPKCHARFRTKDVIYEGLHFHDLRRTAARDAIRAGVSEKIVMEMVGHKTRAMLDRYNIVSDGDLRDAAAKLDKADQAVQITKRAKASRKDGTVRSRFGHVSVTNPPFPGQGTSRNTSRKAKKGKG